MVGRRIKWSGDKDRKKAIIVSIPLSEHSYLWLNIENEKNLFTFEIDVRRWINENWSNTHEDQIA